MKYAIVYCSNTGNTAILANEINEELGDEDCLYVGKPREEAKEADVLYIGFWTDKGSCPEPISQFLKQLHHKQVFLFGTAGFGGDQSYFDRILSNVQKNLPEDNSILDCYMCQGRMPMVVRERYEEMLSQNSKMQGMIENFDKAMSHPNGDDVECLRSKLKAIKR